MNQNTCISRSFGCSCSASNLITEILLNAKAMKVAPKLIFLLRDPEGLVTAIADALHSNPSSSYRRLLVTPLANWDFLLFLVSFFRKLMRRCCFCFIIGREESFELSLEQRYGIKEQKARGQLVHFIDDKGNYQVSLFLFFFFLDSPAAQHKL